ncbi:MAG: DUF1287 domain-containing protein [Fimbriimonas sp.]
MGGIGLFLGGCASSGLAPAPAIVPSGPPTTTAEKIAAHAVEQSGWGTRYDASYKRLAYPNGDVPRERGACTDVVVRALRHVGYDLQKLVHEDARRNRRRYPRIERLDTNIDHRRCPNLVAYFRAYGTELKTDAPWSEWRAGEIVFWKLPYGADHVGIVTGTRAADGRPWVVHNIAGTAHEDTISAWRIVGRFRFPKVPAASRR